MNRYRNYCFIALYIMSLGFSIIVLLWDGATVERMLLAEAPYAHSVQEHDKIVNMAATTRLGIEYDHSLIYLVAMKAITNGIISFTIVFIVSTLLFLIYSDMHGSFMDYAHAFITWVWILAVANFIDPLLKILFNRIAASLSAAPFIRPIDGSNIWHILTMKTDAFFIAYVISAGIGCAAVAKISKIEGIMLIAFVWFALFFVSMLLGIEPILTL